MSICEAAEEKTEFVDSGYFERDDLVNRRWVPVVRRSRLLVLPEGCRSNVLHLAHTIQLADHLRRKKTAMWILCFRHCSVMLSRLGFLLSNCCMGEISDVMLMRDHLEKTAELVQENLAGAQHTQNRWYDRCACE